MVQRSGLSDGLAFWHSTNIKFAAVCGNQGIFSPKAFWWELEIQLTEDVAENFGEGRKQL